MATAVDWNDSCKSTLASAGMETVQIPSFRLCFETLHAVSETEGIYVSHGGQVMVTYPFAAPVDGNYDSEQYHSHLYGLTQVCQLKQDNTGKYSCAVPAQTVMIDVNASHYLPMEITHMINGVAPLEMGQAETIISTGLTNNLQSPPNMTGKPNMVPTCAFNMSFKDLFGKSEFVVEKPATRIDFPVPTKITCKVESSIVPGNIASMMAQRELNWTACNQAWQKNPLRIHEVLGGLYSGTENQVKLETHNKLPGIGPCHPCSGVNVDIDLNCPQQASYLVQQFVKANKLQDAHQLMTAAMKTIHVVSQKYPAGTVAASLNKVDDVTVTNLFRRELNIGLTAVTKYTFDSNPQAGLMMEACQDQNGAQSMLVKGVYTVSTKGEFHKIMGNNKCQDMANQTLSQNASTRCDANELAAHDLLLLTDCEDDAYAFERAEEGAKLVSADANLRNSMYDMARVGNNAPRSNMMSTVYGVIDQSVHATLWSKLEKGFALTKCGFATGVAAGSHPEATPGAENDYKPLNNCTLLQCENHVLNALLGGQAGGHAYTVNSDVAGKCKIDVTQLCATNECLELEMTMLGRQKQLEGTATTRDLSLENKQLLDLKTKGSVTVTMGALQSSKLTVTKLDAQNIFLMQVGETLKQMGIMSVGLCPTACDYACEDGPPQFVKAHMTLHGGACYTCTPDALQPFNQSHAHINDLSNLIRNHAARLGDVQTIKSGKWCNFVLSRQITAQEKQIADYMVQMYRCKVQPGRQKFTNTASIPGGLACNWDRQCELDRLDRVQLIMPRLLSLSASAEQEKAARDNLTEKFNPRAGKLMWNCRGPHQWIMSVQHNIS